MIQEALLTWRYIDTESNLIMPWYAKSCLEWLKQQDLKSWHVFEYGAGYSTIWWRLNSGLTKSIEHNDSWAKAMGAESHPDQENYVKSTKAGEFYDCIIVDGEWREECVVFARNYVKHGGYLIFDNYGQPEFTPVEIIDALLQGWEKQVFRQYNHTNWSTAVFKRP